MRCSSCSYENEEDALYCEGCGIKLVLVCSACGTELKATAKFCRRCGKSTGASEPVTAAAPEWTVPSDGNQHFQAPLEGERKTVTALFADIKGSMELIEDLDPEEARAVVDPALQIMMNAVHHYDGYVAQSTGDGIFALFGAPVASEDHPQRALYAALRMQEEMKRYSDRIRAEGRLPMQVRVGVNTGEVVVRSIRTGAAQNEYTPVGHSTSLAARMQALAPIGSIATTEAVRRLCDGYFTFNDLGPTRVKGVSEPINVFEVTGLGPLRTRLQRSLGRGLTKFVGREREMDVLKRAAQSARSGHGQIVAAIAEAGVGKSRLFYEFKATSQSGWMVLETFSVSHGKAALNAPMVDLLHGYFGIGERDDPRTRREKVAGRIAMLDRDMADILPYVFALLGIAGDDDPLKDIDENVRTKRTLEMIKRMLLRESLNQPVMVIFEDLHWVDERTQAFLNVLADSIGTAKLLLLVNYRPEYSHQWGNKTYYSQLRLDPLGHASATEMLAALLGDDGDLAPLKQLIIQKTEGTPFYIEEMVQMLFDEGALVRNGSVTLTRPLGELHIPPTVQAILATRIDRLPPDAKELLQVLAVIGREFPLSLIEVLLEKPAAELIPVLNELQLGEFIYEQPTIGDTDYVFKHALTQDVAYHSVLLARRRNLHGCIGAAIEALYADSIDDHLGELAHHYGRSADFDAGVQYATDAAKQKIDEARFTDNRPADFLHVHTPATNSKRTGNEMPGSAAVRALKPVSGRETESIVDYVESVWRYPVKSMAGEEIQSCEISERGILGDRSYALVEQASNRAAVVRTWAAALLDYRPQFESEPRTGEVIPGIRILLPDGTSLSSSDPGLNARLSATLGRDLTLMTTAPAGLKIEVAAGTLGGEMRDVTEVPAAAGAGPGTFFDYGSVHLIATSTIESLQNAYPGGLFDVRRFRPNIVVRSHAIPFIENSWVGSTFAIGDEIVLRITIPCPRCSTVALPQAGLPRDPRILRTIAEHNMQDLGEFGLLPCAGVYADVVRPGVLRRGDKVRCLD